jgi:flagellar biosynthesis protein FlhA
MAKSQQNPILNNPIIKSLVNNVLPIISKNPDIGLAIGVLLILALLIIPLPPLLLDFFLAINIAFSILTLLISIYLVRPLEFSSFPTILLITTLFRLGLNVASTKLILGEASAGDIIYAFGNFVIGGNYVVGLIIFIILLVINFVVVIKGSTRIAEVAARFSLDALPGKQMSIDADLNAGYIDEVTARKRRDELSKETDFYGSMDGAAKFIKGDAIAGLIITGINLLGGFVIGMLQHDMTAMEALSTYSILSIGDGLVAQIPALLVSVAGGLVVTRSGASEKLEVELTSQFGSRPKPLYVAGVTMALMAFIPGFPAVPFLFIGLILGGAGAMRSKKMDEESAIEIRKQLAESEDAIPKSEEAPIEDLLKIDPIEIELGYSLITLVDESQGGDVFKRITNVRRQLATELGIILPPVRVRDNLQLDPEKYIIKIRGNEIASNEIYPTMLLAMNPGSADGDIEGHHVTEPVFGLPATWIKFSDREDAEIMGFTVVESPTVLTTHLTEVLRRNADKLINRQDVKHLLENLKNDYPALIEEITPETLPVSTLQKVLQNLLAEGVPIRDLALICESLLEYYKVTKNVDVLTEYVRHNLSEIIKKLYEDQNGVIHTIALDANLEDKMTTALQVNSAAVNSPTLGLPPDTVRGLMNGLSQVIDDVSLMGHLPIIICSAQVRPYLFRMIRATYPMVSVISYTEIPSDSEVEILANLNVA